MKLSAWKLLPVIAGLGIALTERLSAQAPAPPTPAALPAPANIAAPPPIDPVATPPQPSTARPLPGQPTTPGRRRTGGVAPGPGMMGGGGGAPGMMSGGGYGGPGMGGRFGTPVGEPAPELSDEPRELKVIQLRYAEPSVIVNMISELRLPSGGPRCFVDGRTNSLLLLGTAEEFRLAEDLIQKLDVPAKEQSSGVAVRIYQTKYAQAKAVAAMLQQLLGNRSNIALDERSNQVIVSGDPNLLEETGRLISQLDQSEPSRAPVQSNRKSHRVRLVWLTSNAECPPLPPDMADVAEELGSIGIGDLHLGAQAMVQAVSGTEFSLHCTPTFSNASMLTMEGMLEEDADGPQLQIKLSVKGKREGLPAAPNAPGAPPGMRGPLDEIASLSTRLSAPIGHKIVIGVTPMGETSVFIIQLTDEKTPAKAAASLRPAPTAPVVAPAK